MAEFRSIKCAMWREDDWFQSLKPDERLLFIYLFSNPSAPVAGIYKLPLRTMAFESGVSESRCNEILKSFARAGKVFYESGVVWVRRMREHQLPGVVNAKLQTRIEKDVAAVPDGPLKTRYLATYSPPTRVSIPYGYGMDTVSIPICTDTDTDTDTETEGGVGAKPETAPAAPPPSVSPPKAETPPKARNAKQPKSPPEPKPTPPPAIEALRRIVGIYPPTETWQVLAAACTGRTEAQMRQTFAAWQLVTTNKHNWSWVTDWLPYGGRPPKNGVKPAPTSPPPLTLEEEYEHSTPDQRAEIDAIRAATGAAQIGGSAAAHPS